MRCCPVAGGLAEVLAVGEIEEDRTRRMHELRDGRCVVVGVQREIGCEGVDQGVPVVAG
jgi:hypothetical protein